jgi:hypothetical protein
MRPRTRASEGGPVLAMLAVLTMVPTGDAANADDKSRYTLWNPTPKALMRELAADRPDKTESAYTVDAGHVQVEMDVVSYAYDRERDAGVATRTDAFAVAPINLKVGLTNRMDLQLVIETWNHLRTTTDGAPRDRHGFGDVTARLKYNLWGNDGGPTALAAMPFLKFPTNQDGLGNDSVEGGLILPFAAALPREFGLGAQAELDAIRDEAHDGHHVELIGTLTVNRDLIGDLGGYVEVFSLVSSEPGADWVATADGGLTYGVTEDLQLDAGVNVGITAAADDVNPFLGLTYRR